MSVDDINLGDIKNSSYSDIDFDENDENYNLEYSFNSQMHFNNFDETNENETNFDETSKNKSLYKNSSISTADFALAFLVLRIRINKVGRNNYKILTKVYCHQQMKFPLLITIYSNLYP